MPKNPLWPGEAEKYLEDNWGVKTVPYIAKKLNKTEGAVISKAGRLGLGSTKCVTDKLTASELAKTVGVNSSTVNYWLKNCGLKFVSVVTCRKKKFNLIDINDFWKWAFKNQERLDTRLFEPGTLGVEPKWVKQKRKDDLLDPVRKFKRYSPTEDSMLRTMAMGGSLSVREMAKQLNRPSSYIYRRLNKAFRQKRSA